MTASEFTLALRSAADYIDAHGWTQGTEKAADGSVCLTGAIRVCAPQPGDFYLIREVLRNRERAELWNDRNGRRRGEVTRFLRTASVSDADLRRVFGPGWSAIVALVRRAAVLTDDEAESLNAAWVAAWVASWAAEWAAAWVAARPAARNAAWAAASAAARDAAWSATSDAASDAAWALLVRDLIGSHGFTADHYRTLTRPWASVIGPVHPDDERDGLLAVTA